MKEKIWLYALENAVKFKGKANPGAIIGKILGEFPKVRKDSAKVMKEIQLIVKKVNVMSLEEQKAELEKRAPGFEKKKKKEKQKRKEVRLELPPLPKAVMGKVITRMPPEPSKYNHVGHAMSFLINYLYAQKYKGKCILRFEDTNPVKVNQEFIDSAKEDLLDYLEIKPSKIIFVSDDMEKLYKHAEEIIKKKHAYVCFCERDSMQQKRMKGIDCECRKTDAKKNLEEWKKMIKGQYKEGKCILRLKGDMKHKNAVMRDPVIFRIVKKSHYKYKTKYCCWPMYDFYNAVEENFCKITHVLRSAEFDVRVELQDYIRKLFGYKNPQSYQYGRINIKGSTTKGREIRELIEKGAVTGWDDPRLVTLKAMRRRGFVKETFYELAIKVGLSKTQTNIDWTLLFSTNRKFLDKSSDRYFFIEEPKEITIKDAPKQDLELDLHPEYRKGGRKFKTGTKFIITKKDYNNMLKAKKDTVFRLMDCLNFRLEGKKFVFHSQPYTDFKESKGKIIIHWLPVDKNNVDIKIRTPENKLIKGIAESGVKNLKQGAIVQFERFAFARLDNKKKMEFIYTHS
jgi:glutamyl-tRNA synthetase